MQIHPCDPSTVRNIHLSVDMANIFIYLMFRKVMEQLCELWIIEFLSNFARN